MAGSWKGYFKIVTPEPKSVTMRDNDEGTGGSLYNNFSWYQKLIQGSASRLSRYKEYDQMDEDVEVQRALDTIAEEMTGNNPKTNEPLEIEVLVEDEDNIHNNSILTVKAALRKWNRIHDWENRLFPLSRYYVKYGDVFFRRPKTPFTKWTFLHPRNVIAAIVEDDDPTHILAWQVRKEATDMKIGSYVSVNSAGTEEANTELVDAKDIISFSTINDMSESAPFGTSILQAVYKAHKQKELLEDAVIIYRVQRAPERRVFYIDVGKMPPQRVKQYLEQIKNEIKQKKVPTVHGDQAQVDSIYNPQSTSEDFFLGVRPDGRGTKVETLPGGQGLGELSDLEYFQRKVWRGLRVPASYMIEQQDGGQIWNDNKVGVAYIQELRFALYIMRLQGNIEKVLDCEFKKFLKQSNILIDDSIYRIRLPSPSNFGKYKEMEVDSALLSQFSQADGIQYLSKRFILSRYLMLTHDEIIQNERMLREEKGLDPETNSKDYPTLYGANGEMGGGFGGGGLGGFGGLGDEPGMGGVEGDLGMTTGEGGNIGTETGGDVGGSSTTGGDSIPNA